MFAAIDFVCLSASLALLLWLLGRTEIFQSAARLGRWLQASLALGCFLLYLLWSFWFQKPETHATLLLLVLSAAAAQWRQRIPAVIALIALAAAGATVRADAMVAFHAGFLAACLLPQSRSLPLGRVTQVVASVLSIAAAIGVQYVIMHHVYPNTPRQVSAFQLVSNLKSWLNYFVVGGVAVSLVDHAGSCDTPLAYAEWLDGRTPDRLRGALCALLHPGIAWEVRIFLPFAMTLVPATVTLGYAAIFNQPRAEAASPAR